MVQAARYFLQERIKIAEAYLATKSVVQTQRQFRRDFPGRNSPTRFTKKHLLDEFWEAGAVKDNVEGRSGRPLSDKTENIMMIMRVFGAFSKEIHKTFVPKDRSFKGSDMRIMHEDLHLFPYKIQILQLQTDANKAEKRDFGQTINQQIKDQLDFLGFIFSVTRQISTLVAT